MTGWSRSDARVRAKDEAEKPFWISYADLMTALMVLFLVVMSVALLAVTKKVDESERARVQYNRDVEAILDRFSNVVTEPRFEGISIDRQRYVVDFGTRAQFPFGRSTLTVEQQKLLRSFVPAVLAKLNDELAQRLLKRISVDGFTDKTGSYLTNLNLSLARSQRVMCALLAEPEANEVAISVVESSQIRALFTVGGYSFNAAKGTAEDSRRVEMRLEFWGVGESPASRPEIGDSVVGDCVLSE